MKTLLEVVNLSASFLKERGIERAKREAEDLIAFALQLKRIDLYLYHDRPLMEEELASCRDYIKKRSLGIPSQYIMGEVLFAGCKIYVNQNVLIPRPETEILVEKVATFLSHQNVTNKVLWDVCTGSGCMAIALKKRFPELVVKASDISPLALETAKKNALENNVDVLFLEGDLLTPFGEERCDYFLCNPPYISKTEFDQLSTEVKTHEPSIALLAGTTGLEYYERLAHALNPCVGWLEIGSSQGADVKLLFENCGWTQLEIEKDWAGHDRFLNLGIKQ